MRSATNEFYRQRKRPLIACTTINGRQITQGYLRTNTVQIIISDNLAKIKEIIKMERKSKLQMISVDKLHPHPQNPRKVIGDVTELAESIKANGILQNLTVVPKMITGMISRLL